MCHEDLIIFTAPELGLGSEHPPPTAVMPIYKCGAEQTKASKMP